MKKYQELVQKVASLGADSEKTAKGNKSAGVRLRAGMQEVKALADQLRKDVLEVTRGE